MKRNRILYFSLIAISLVFVYFYSGKVPYTLLYVLLVLPFMSFIYTLLIYFRFKYTQKIDKKFITKGDKVTLTFEIQNEDFLLYPYISLSFYGSENIFSNQFETKNFSLYPFEKKAFTFELECKYRGIYNIGINYIIFQDLLGILSLRYKAFEPKIITVSPRILKLDRFDIKTSFISDSQVIHNSKFEDMSTVSDIRRYSYGDSFKRIHWKLTSKLNRIMVKNFQSTSQASAVIILDLRKNSFSFEENTIIEDTVIESALSVISYCLSNWISIELVFYSDRIVNIKAGTPMDFSHIYKTLSLLKFEADVALTDIIDIYLSETIGQNNLFVFTSNLDYGLYDELYKARFSGNEVSLIYTSSPYRLIPSENKDAESILEFIPQIDIDLYKIDINSDIKTILER